MDQFENHPLYRRHNIDSVMSSLWDFYKRKFLPLFITSFVMSLVIQYASSMVDMAGLSSITDPVLLLEKFKGLILPILAVSVINLLFTTILHYYIIFNPVDSGTNIFTAVIRSLKYFIPYLIIMILLAFAGSIAVVLGVFVLIVGAFFAMLYVVTLYMFLLPVMMVENTNIGTSISRTFTLTHKHFWTNIGWVAIFIILMLVISVILSGIILIPFSGSFLKTILKPEEAANLGEVTTRPLYIILSSAVNAITMPLMPIFACILYFNGRANEEIIQNIQPDNTEENKVRVEDLYARPYADDHPDNPENKVSSQEEPGSLNP